MGMKGILDLDRYLTFKIIVLWDEEVGKLFVLQIIFAKGQTCPSFIIA